MTGLSVDLVGVGLQGPGLAGWGASLGALRDATGWVPAPTALPPPSRLPAAERRRSGSLVRVSLAVADEALAHAAALGMPIDPAGLATVFTSSSGDTLNCHALCEALVQPERAVSPTRFTNSVHNATAGYWHIATASRAPSISLCGFDASFAAGLLEAVAQCNASGAPVLLVVSDIPYPQPLHAQRPMPDAFGLALLLAPAGDARALARLTLPADALSLAPHTPCSHEPLDALRRAVPAARALPLLQALALGEPAHVVLEGFGGGALGVTLTRPAGSA
jgi:Beta-ketoacyl synthase, N-terminal domain